MLRSRPKQTTFYSSIYDKIPDNHILRRIGDIIDFGFVNDILKDSYCENFGRPAKEPEMMMKLLLLQYLYDLSDVKVIEEANLNLAFLYFLGLNPEDTLPDPSLLAKFRTHRLDGERLDDMLSAIVRQCVAKGIIKGDGVSIDATHIEANCTKKTPERVMKHMAKRIFRGLEADNGGVPEGVDTDIPDYTRIEGHKEAKAVMEGYVRETVESARPHAGPATEKAIAEAEGVLGDERFLLQTGVRSLSDKDARVGHKSRTDSFFGYKKEFVMTTDERFIVAVRAYSGEHVDGKDFGELMGLALRGGVEVKEVFGDKAYCRPGVYDWAEARGVTAYVPVSGMAYRVDEGTFSYNKDSDQWVCLVGNRTVSKKASNTKRGVVYVYGFDKGVCMCCAHRDGCMGKSAGRDGGRRLRLGADATRLYEISQWQKSAGFLEKYRKRAAHEWKNGEMKRFHGLARARGRCLESVSTQAKLTAIAVNLKRAAAIVAEMEGTAPKGRMPLFLRLVAMVLRSVRGSGGHLAGLGGFGENIGHA